jgi:TRAP-type mannitol/chloroaromatic compound transport system permease large subunit
MENDTVAIPLFLFMGYVVERANIVDRLFFHFIWSEFAGVAGHRRIAHLRSFFNSIGNRYAVVIFDGFAGLSRDGERYNKSLRQA